MSMVFQTCVYYLETMKESSTSIPDLTNVCLWSFEHICHFEVVKKVSAATVDLLVMSRWVAGTVMWLHCLDK
jgi:hypothetical protein